MLLSSLDTINIKINTDRHYSRCFKVVQQLFERCFRDSVSPTKITMWKNIMKYKTKGSSLNLNKDRSDRSRTERTQEIIDLLQEKFIEDPRISARRIGLDISKSIFNRIPKHDLK